MKYTIVSDKGYEYYRNLLTKEIERFDVRAEIVSVSFDSIDKKIIKTFAPASTIYLGSRPNLYKKLTRLKCLHFCISLMSDEESISSLKLFHLAYATTPAQFEFYKERQINTEYLGNPLIDELRVIPSDDTQEPGNRPSVAINLGNRPKKSVLRKVRSLIQSTDKYTFYLISAGDELEYFKSFPNCETVVQSEKYSKLKSSNVAITSSPASVLESLLLNVPQVVIPYQTGFSPFSQPKNAQKKIVNEDFAKCMSKKGDILSEINRLLTDFEYCASILEKYQKSREQIGMEPFFRRVGKQIVEEVEVKQL